jgi:prephenate dehydrogenase
MNTIHEQSASIYEGLADNNQEETLASIDALYRTLEELTEQISDGAEDLSAT